MADTKEVIALSAGYFGSLRAAGDKFVVPSSAKASWFADVKADAEPAAQGKRRGAKKAEDTGAPEADTPPDADELN